MHFGFSSDPFRFFTLGFHLFNWFPVRAHCEIVSVHSDIVVFTAIHFDLTLASFRSGLDLTSSSLRFHVDLTLKWLLHNSEITSKSLRCHIGITSVSSRFDFAFTSDSLISELDITLISLWCHFGFTSSSHQFYFDVTSVSFWCRLRFTSCFLRFHVFRLDSSSCPLRSTKEKGKTPADTHGKRESSPSEKWNRNK